MSTLDGPIWSRCSSPSQVTFPAHTEQGKMGPELGWTLPLINRRRIRRRRRAREGQEKRKRENRWPILKKLWAALLRLFRVQHSEEMKGSARGNWDPREAQQLFRPNPNGVNSGVPPAARDVKRRARGRMYDLSCGPRPQIEFFDRHLWNLVFWSRLCEFISQTKTGEQSNSL